MIGQQDIVDTIMPLRGVRRERRLITANKK